MTKRLFVKGESRNVSGASIEMETQPENLKKSWISEHPRIVIGLILAVCLGPFINKAIHVDDPLFVWMGQWSQKHPADFFGFNVVWQKSAIPMWAVNWNPPLMACFLAEVAGLFGWNEIALHLAGLVIAVTAAAGIYSLAQMWCERPLLATMVAIFTPAFLVSSTTLMCDVLMLTFWIWALVFWERALAKEQGRWRFVLAGVLAGLAVLTKYSAVTLLPLFPILGILRTRKPVWWLVGLAVPLFMLAGYEWLTARMYGTGLFSAALNHTQNNRDGFDWEARGIIGLAFAGGNLLPLLFFAPFLWRRQALLVGGAAIFGVLFGMILTGNFQLIKTSPELMNLLMHRWGFVLQLMLLTAAGTHLLLLVGAEAWTRRDAVSLTLVLWIVSGLFSIIVLNFMVNARSFLLVVPAAAILLVRRLRPASVPVKWEMWFLWPLLPAVVITLSLVRVDYRVANSARTAAEQIAAQYISPDHKLWFEGHWGFHYYMEKLGGSPVDVERSLLQPGDVVVIPFDNYSFIPLPPGSVGWVKDLQYSPDSWINLSVCTASAAGGFYSSILGPVPFAAGKVAPHTYCIFKVYSKVQFNAQPVNRREMRTGALPAYTNVSFSAGDNGDNLDYPVKPGVAGEMELADRSQMDGDFQGAIQHYRKALDLDANDPVVLNDLAWMLATTGEPGLRDGPEAVRLATRAVELTDSRWPICIGTLAAACAQAGQFPEAVKKATIAFNLAQVTGQTEVAAKNARLGSLYAAGKTVDASGNP
jgi:4-amino-4-deoxy-L-arabinose transferase-like glycosyltransferase